MKTIGTGTIGVLLSMGVATSLPALGQASTQLMAGVTSSPSAPTKIFAENGVAIRGTDPVAYFTQRQPVQGRQDLAYQWNGVTWWFATAQHRTQFAQNPEAYTPQYGGFCAYGVAQGALVEIDPGSWAIVEGKLYLNYNAAVQQLWEEDIPGHIAQANRNWPRL